MGQRIKSWPQIGRRATDPEVEFLPYNKLNKFIETDITDRIEIITKHLETSQIIIGFMLDNKKRKLLN